jgi:hypothetical protein
MEALMNDLFFAQRAPDGTDIAVFSVGARSAAG